MNRLFKGKKPATRDRRDLLFDEYRTGSVVLPPHPDQFGHENLVTDWGMLGNGPDETVAPGFQGAGDCVFAGGGHETKVLNAVAGHPVIITGKEAIADYAAVTGYDITQTDANGDNPTDQGTSVRDALKYRQQVGLLDAEGNRHKIFAYLAIEAGNWNQLLEAIYLCDTVGIGLNLPQTAMDQFNAGQPWGVVPGATSSGGHYVSAVALRDTLLLSTWGALQPTMQEFYEEYSDEAWGILSEESTTNGKTEEGFDMPTLLADMKYVKTIQ